MDGPTRARAWHAWLDLLSAAGTRASQLLRRPRLSRWALGGALALSLCGCTTLEEYVHNGFKVGPNYKRPPAPVAQRWIDADDKRVRSEAEDDSHWWTVFNDPALSDLVQNAYRQDLTLREAGYRVLQARAQFGIAVGEFLPQTQVTNGDVQAKGVSVNVANRVATPQRWFGQWDYGFGLSWELDFWGRFRRAIESAEDSLDASVENYDDVLVTLIGDVASTYVEYRTLEQRIAYARENVRLQTEVLSIATARFKGGQTSDLDVNQAQSDLSATEALIPQLEISLREANDRLCILLGTPPEDLRRKLGAAPIPTAPASVAVGIPADLLRRRPDVRRAERQAAAQCALIGVAEADFYPSISLTTTFGWSSQHLQNLFAHGSFRGTVGPTFQWEILNYCRILNNVRKQDADFQALVVAYQNTALKANGEVEDGLVKFLKAQEETRYAKESVEAELKAVKDAVAQYKGGLVDFNRVAVIQERLVGRQEQLAQAQGSIALGLVKVYKALGGGWQIRCGEETVAAPAPVRAPGLTLIPLENVPGPKPVPDKPGP
jgi:NodT family efflux transporter outer membrane factor (OMF) lipoprotein